MNMKKTKPALYDKQIIDRVKLYLEENVNQTYLDVSQMTKQLMQRYPEYTRRKFTPFRQLVEKAFHIVSQTYGLSQETSSNECSEGSDSEPLQQTVSKNLINSMMNSLYNKPAKPISEKPASSEPIDIISSDESEVEGPSTNGKLQNSDTAVLEDKNKKASMDAHKKRNHSPAVGTEDQCSKKSKLLENQQIGNGANVRSGHDHSRKQQLQSMMYNQNSNDSMGGGSIGSRHMRPRRYKKELRMRKSNESFQDVGGMESTLKELCELLINIKSPDIYFSLGLMPPRGILLFGPPGSGKTLLAHAIAGQLNLPIMEVASTELIAGVSGESEERIRDIFEQAVECSPCVLFIDEIDAISSNRSMAQKDMERRIVSQLISSLDSLKISENGQSVLVVGATTRPDVLDPALRRVGRFDHEVSIRIPTRKDRKDILAILCEGLTIEPHLEFDKIAELTPGYVGADLLALVSRAASIAVKRKCTQRFRDLHAKPRTIDFVDLDVDDDEGESATKNQNREEKDSAKSSKADDSKTNDSSNKEPAKDTEKESAKKDEKNEKDKKDEKDEKAENDEAAKPNPAIESMDVDESNAEEQPVAKEVKEVEKKPEESAPFEQDTEPKLCELLNWLDNPPDDFGDPNFCITFADFCAAIKVVQPSAKREGFITVPDTTWDDIGSLEDIREELKLAVLAPVKFPEKLARLGLNAPSGVLLCGPPGCGKTLLAKAIANEAGINFISVKGPELMNMYVGESERAVRACFQRARNSAPCVIFFDEFDSLCPKRSDGNDSGSGTRIVNQLLTEMDGVEERKGVYILAASNRPDIIDPAILRPGRLDTILYVGLPQERDRVDILKATTKNGTRPVLATDVDIADIAAQTDGYTGADLAGLVKQASMLALRDSLKSSEIEIDADLFVCKKNFDEALKMLRPSVSPQDRKTYEKLRQKYAAPRVPLLTADKD